MPKFVSETIPIDDYAEIGAIQRGNNKYWYVRMYWKEGKQSSYKSLSLPYETGLASSRTARKAGLKKYQEFLAKVSIGLSPTSTTDISNITDEYFRHINALAKENDVLLKEGQRPKWQVKGGKGFYSVSRCKGIADLLPYLEKFWRTLPSQDMGAITFNQLEGFDDWMNKEYTLSPSRRAKIITQIRMIWRYGREKGYVNWVPNPSRPPQELKERARRNLKEEEWELMRAWAINQVKELEKDKYARKEQRDIAQQFYLWFQVISWTGIRPPNGSVEKNLLRWGSYKKIKRNGETEKRLFHRKDEKGHDYTATIHPRGWRYFDALEDFHKNRGTWRKDGYLFCHTHTRKNTYEVGSPIANFYKQWKKMLIELGLDSPKGTPQNTRLVPYSLRGYYITMRLRYGKVSIDKLASACGTSAKIILQTYYDFSSEKEYEELNQGFELEDDAPGVEFDDEGFLIANSLDEAMMEI